MSHGVCCCVCDSPHTQSVHKSSHMKPVHGPKKAGDPGLDGSSGSSGSSGATRSFETRGEPGHRHQTASCLFSKSRAQRQSSGPRIPEQPLQENSGPSGRV